MSLLTDTTSKHGSHIFDTNCAICTGKQSTDKKDYVKTKDKDITKLRYYLILWDMSFHCYTLYIYQLLLSSVPI